MEELKTLKDQIKWCIESIKELADAINNKKPSVVLKDNPPNEPPGEPKP